MKYILIIGAKDSGKSSTINAICKNLNPSKILRLTVDALFEEIDVASQILNGTYLLVVNNKNILVVAGAPTEQGLRITVILEICIKLNITIDFTFATMRTFEKAVDDEEIKFDTRTELERLGQCFAIEKIYSLGENYLETNEWQERIEKLTNLIKGQIEEEVLQH